MKKKLSQDMEELLQRVTEWRDLINSHPMRGEAEQFLLSYIEPGALDVLKPEWIDSIELPEDLIGGFQIGSLSEIPFLSEIKSVMIKKGFKPYGDTRKNMFAKIRDSGNQLILSYDVAPRARSIMCRLTYRGSNWQHNFFLVFSKGYKNPQYGIDSLVQLKKAITNLDYLLGVVEEQILTGLDKIYGNTPKNHHYPEYIL